MSSESKSRVLYENLDTSFVNLWALLRHLSQRAFVGRVHVEMADYSADVFLTGSNTPLVHEVDRAAGSDVLEELRGTHPIIDLILEHRQLQKLKGTYVDALQTLVDPSDGRVHTSFNQTVAATGFWFVNV